MKTEKRFKPFAAVYLLYYKNNKLLSIKRAGSGFYDGYYSLPAGHIDGDEKASNALKRESLEEVGIKLQTNKLQFAHLMHRKSTQSEKEIREYFDLFYIYKDNDLIPAINEPKKILELKYCFADKLPTKTIPYIKFALDQIIKKKIYSEYGW